MHVDNIAQSSVNPGKDRLPALSNDAATTKLGHTTIINKLEVIPVLQLQACEVLQVDEKMSGRQTSSA